MESLDGHGVDRFSSLPANALLLIFSFLAWNSRFRCAWTCQRFHTLLLGGAAPAAWAVADLQRSAMGWGDGVPAAWWHAAASAALCTHPAALEVIDARGVPLFSLTYLLGKLNLFWRPNHPYNETAAREGLPSLRYEREEPVVFTAAQVAARPAALHTLGVCELDGFDLPLLFDLMPALTVIKVDTLYATVDEAVAVLQRTRATLPRFEVDDLRVVSFEISDESGRALVEALQLRGPATPQCLLLNPDAFDPSEHTLADVEEAAEAAGVEVDFWELIC